MTTSVMRKLFAEGMYSQCLAEIDANMQLQGTTLTEQLILHNNKEICQVMMPHCNHYQRLKEHRHCLQNILDKCASTPVRPDILQLELVVLYNCAATHAACTTLETRPTHLDTSLCSPPYSACVKTLLRLYRLLHASEYHSVRMQLSVDDKHNCYTIMDQCLDRLTVPTDSVGLLWSVALCCCMLAVVEMLLGNTEPARHTLQKLKGILEIQAGLMTEVPTNTQPIGLQIPLQLEPNFVHPCGANCLDVCNFLLSVCDFKDERWSDCIQSIQSVQCTEMVDAAKYLTGMCLFRTEKYIDALPMLSDLAATSSFTQKYRAQLYCNIGNCLSKMNKPQLAIHMYKEALAADFGSLSPLYSIAIQHRQLGTTDMELQCLQSLVMALSNKSTDQSDATTSTSVDLYQMVHLRDDDVTYHQALYTLAQQYTHYHRHEEASKSYLDLINYLTGNMDTRQVLTAVGIPPTIQIYHETMESLLKATKYTDCIAVCDRTLLGYHNNTIHGNSDNSENDSCISNQEFDVHVTSSQLDTNSKFCDLSRKRKRFNSRTFGSDKCSSQKLQLLTDSIHNSSCVDCLDKDIVTLQCKAKALVNLGDLQAARECLQSAVDSVEAYRLQTFQAAAAYPRSSPPGKRQRHVKTCNSNSSIMTDNYSVNNVEDKEANRLAQLESDLYLCLGSTLEEQDKLSDALHCYRLAAQLTPGEVRIAYQCTQTLIAMSQPRQAATNWLGFRNIPVVSSYVKMKRQLETKQQLVKSSDTELASEDEHLVEMDITCLEHAVKYCH